MRKTLPLLTAAGLACALMIGCDRQAAQHAAAGNDLNQAVRIVNAANRGYIPSDAQTKTDDLAAYRQNRLQEAVQILEKVRDSGGQEDQKLLATRLLSQLKASAASHQLHLAMDAFTEVRADSTDLLSQLDTAHRAASEVRNYNRDPEALVGRLQQQIQQQQKSRDQLQQRIQQIQDQLDQAKAKAKKLRAKSDQMAGKAQKTRSQAFVAQGDKQYDLYNQAAEIESAGTSASFEGDKQDVAAEALGQRLKPLQTRLQSVNQSIDQLNRQIEATRADAADAQDKLKGARQRQSQTLSRLTQSFDKLVGRFDKTVRQPLADASKRMDQAVVMLDKVSSGHRDAQLDLLNRRVQQAALLAQRAIALGGFATTLDTVHRGAAALDAPDAQHFAQAHQKIADAHQQILEKARQAVQAGQSLAQSMGSDDEVKAQARQLADLQQQLQEK